jgi:hypothetical protein
MAAGCTESGEVEAGVRMPRSVEAFQVPEGVERRADKQKDRQPGEWPRPGDGPSLENPVSIRKMGNILRLF